MPTIEGTIVELNQQHSSDIIQGHLKKIVETYDLEWRVVHELVQNAIDAIQTNSEIAEGQVDLVLDLDNDEVTVTDNGTGFVKDTKLLCPNGTGAEKRLSSRSPAKGYQGIGLKAVMYSTTLFEIESETEKQRWTFLAENLASYIASEESNIPKYKIDDTKPRRSDKTYTAITACFPNNTLCTFLSGLDRFLKGDSVRWQDLYRKEREDRQSDPIDKYLEHFFSWYFRTQSYIGCVNKLLNIPVKNVSTNEFEDVKPVTIRVQIKSQRQFAGINGIVGQWLQHLGTEKFTTEIPNCAWDYHEIAIANHERAIKYHIAPDIVTMPPNDPNWDTESRNFQDRFLALKLTPKNTENFHERYADFIQLLERSYSRIKAEHFEDVLEVITGIYVAIGRTAAFETLGITNRGMRVIASNGTLTDHSLTAVTTSSTWYLETIHMIINVDANLNVGKRHLVNTRLVGRIQEFFEACYPTLVNISKRFVERDSDLPDEDPLPNVVGLEKLRRENVPFRRFPDDENTLIGLFSVTIGILDKNFSVYGYFGKARYDGKFRWITDEPGSDNDLLKLEFKVLLVELVKEFDSSVQDKEFTDVGLIVVWDRRLDTNQWHVRGISETRRNELEHRGIPTNIVEYVLEDQRGTYRPLICVADLLQQINLVNGETDDLDTFVEQLG